MSWDFIIIGGWNLDDVLVCLFIIFVECLLEFRLNIVICIFIYNGVDVIGCVCEEFVVFKEGE